MIRHTIAIVAVFIIAGSAYAQRGGTTTVTHTNPKGQVSTTVVVRSGGYVPAMPGPYLTDSVRLIRPVDVVEVSGMSTPYVATINGKAWWTGSTYTVAQRNRLICDAIQKGTTVVVRQGSRVVDILEP